MFSFPLFLFYLSQKATSLASRIVSFPDVSIFSWLCVIRAFLLRIVEASWVWFLSLRGNPSSHVPQRAQLPCKGSQEKKRTPSQMDIKSYMKTSIIRISTSTPILQSQLPICVSSTIHPSLSSSALKVSSCLRWGEFWLVVDSPGQGIVSFGQKPSSRHRHPFPPIAAPLCPSSAAYCPPGGGELSGIACAVLWGR